MKNLLKNTNSVVIKVGSKTITTDHSINTNSIENLARTSYELIKKRKKVSIVTSGAIAAERRAINDLVSASMAEKQMLAAIGQPLLMQEYIRIFEQYGLKVGQFLLSKEDFENPGALSRLRNSYQITLERNIVPIINENDPVTTHEIKLGDNDELQALITRDLNADLAINLITYPGLLRNKRIVKIADSYNAADYDNLSVEVKEGRGGLQGKLNAMQIVTSAGKYGIIGSINANIVGMIKGIEIHTRFNP
ncbi:MAG: hypothetical protein AABX85_03690 [Nanoarchaeota archaeon]